jgi:uncharacterized protein YjbI with pentapeptide repeats
LGFSNRYFFCDMKFAPYMFLSLFALTASANAYQKEHLEKLKETGSCVNCDLIGADLSDIHFGRSGFGHHVGADLRGADLSGANLRQVDLDDANLNKTTLISVAMIGDGWPDYTALIGDPIEASIILLIIKRHIDLVSYSKDALAQVHKRYGNDWRKTDLPDNVRRSIALAVKPAVTDLRGARLRRANLSEAILIGTDLRNADLTAADLSKAILIKANLSGTILTNTDLSDANLAYADLQGAVFEPPRDRLPDRFSIRKTQNLHTMTFSNNPDGLVELRNMFREAGRRDLERRITFAINKAQRKKAAVTENLFKYVFFELTCDYGMSPGRPLWILLGLIAVFTVPYMGAVHASRKEKWGVWRVWSEDRIHDRQDDKQPQRVKATGYYVPLWAIYFSLLSAFHIGWRDLNVGAWIARLHPQEFTLRATGWVKVVSGIQALISVYLIALWVLTYFGRPFE